MFHRIKRFVAVVVLLLQDTLVTKGASYSTVDYIFLWKKKIGPSTLPSSPQIEWILRSDMGTKRRRRRRVKSTEMLSF